MDWLSDGRRAQLIDTWWSGLSELDRERARFFANDDRDLPRGLFLGLCDAGVLAVAPDFRRAVEARRTATFPMPEDVRSYVRLSLDRRPGGP